MMSRASAPRARVLAEAVPAAVALLAVAVWMGGLLALGALAAPAVFAIVPLPASADAMTVVFRRFDAVAMGCAAMVLATEALRAATRVASRRLDRMRVAASVAAAAAAVFEGTVISPRIAHLHALGVLRGSGSAGTDLSRLHDIAEACGKTQVLLLAAVIALQVLALSWPPAEPPRVG